MNIAFLILRMNALVYFVPLAKHLKSLGHNVIFEIAPKQDDKYNSVQKPKNYLTFVSLLEGGDLKFTKKSSMEDLFCADYDYMFSLEGAGYAVVENNFHSKFKHIIIQNLNDYSFSAQYPATEGLYKQSDFIWMHDEFHANILRQDLHHVGNIIVANLPNCWYYKNKDKQELLKEYDVNLNGKKLAICFLPRPEEILSPSWVDVRYTPTEKMLRSGNPVKYVQHALDFAKHLENNGYFVILKQRAKNRDDKLMHLPNYIEDGDFWFPSMPMDFTYMADLCYGYRSSSVMDANTFGIKYIDFYKTEFASITEKIFNHYNCSVHMDTKFEDIDIQSLEKIDLNAKITDAQKLIEGFFNV